MNNERSFNPSPVILERSLFSIACTKIDVSQGTLRMEFDGKVVHFNIFSEMKYPITLYLCLPFILLIPLCKNFLNLIVQVNSKLLRTSIMG